jgi:hypothetical protein
MRMIMDFPLPWQRVSLDNIEDFLALFERAY